MYFVFGDFSEPPTLTLSRAKYRSEGLPAGINVMRHGRASQPEMFDSLLDGYAGESLQTQHPDVCIPVAKAPSCVRVQGFVADPPDLRYLRDTVGVLTALLDGGGVAVLDLLALWWWTPQAWHQSIFGPAGPIPRHHVSILFSEGDMPDTEWFHTRGLRKFGRPNVSVRDVPPEGRDGVIDLCNRLIEMQAFGAVMPDGQVRTASLPPGMVLKHCGSLDDPDFNNVHIEARFPRQPDSG